jgi:hypothetical protein
MRHRKQIVQNIDEILLNAENALEDLTPPTKEIFEKLLILSQKLVDLTHSVSMDIHNAAESLDDFQQLYTGLED